MNLARKMGIALGLIAICWAAILILWGPAPFAFSFDDAYYYFTIGRNWAHGYASTFNQIDTTNGYHPLWQLICILPFALGLDGFAAVRALLALQLVLWICAMWLVIRSVTAQIANWKRLGDNEPARRFCNSVVVVVFVVLAANPFVFKMIVNGLESGLVVPISAALIVNAVKFRGRFISLASASQRWIIGVLLALAFLARTDAIILIGVIAVSCVFDAKRTSRRMGNVVVRLVELFTIPVVVVAGYLVINQIFFDMPVQVSGAIKRLPLTPGRAVVALVWAAVGLAVLVATSRPIKRTSRLLRTRRFVTATGWYAAFCIGLVGYYSTLQAVPYLWYFAPLALYALFLALLLSADLTEGAILEAAEPSGSSASFATRAPGLILLVPLVIAFVWSVPGFTDPGTRSIMVHDTIAARWMSGHLPPGARVASWDAGVIGYFSHRKIVNLDGVVGNREFFDAVRGGSWGVPDFLSARNVRWVSNHGGAVKGRDPDIDKQIRTYFGDDAARRITVVFSTNYDYTGTIDGSRTDTSTKRMGSYVYRLDP